MKSLIKLVFLLVCSITSAQTNLLDTSTWTIGTGSAPGFNRTGTDGENIREMGIGPHGTSVLLWKTIPEATGNSGAGGWSTDLINIDPTKTYRFTVWLKKTNSFDGNTPFRARALDASDNLVVNNLNGSPHVNPYFGGADVPTLDQWYLLVGFMHHDSYTNTVSIGGLYNGATGNKDQDATDYKFQSTATKIYQSIWLSSNNNANDSQFYYAPTMYEVNGQEPTIQELIDGPDTQVPTAPTLSSTTQTDTTVDLSWTAATDDTAVTEYKVYKDGILETTLGNVLTYQITGLTAATGYNFTVTALDAASNESVASNTLVITTNASIQGISLPFRVNAGGLETTYSGNTFLLDQYFTGGNTSEYLAVPEVYNNERWGDFSYDVPVENGNYDVILHFIEAHFNAVNLRVFDVKMEGVLVLDNYDIYQENGENQPATKLFNNVEVNDGILNLEFSTNGTGGEVDTAKLSGFEILNSNTDTQIPTTSTLSSTGQTDTTVDLSWTAATDNVAVTGYKVYKEGVLETTLGNVLIYQVTGLTGSTAYNFTVTALDAVGNESVDSNILAITTNAASGGGSGNWTLNNQDVYYNLGNVGIGTTIPDSKLTVKGSIHSEEVKIDLSVPAPDYVFETDYNLTPLEKLRNYIKTYKHLPNIPTAKEMEANGVELGIMNMKLLEKIEELTLYILQQQKVLNEQVQKNEMQEKRLTELEKLTKG
ncbi:malectin domain-containing carbohydrate-binding protein [Flavivirga amylovorans]|uniref:Malectin domain-containing carbohydrate-binding protein n=1 Tax=Flavivirga amylovorans TaxID=870486 RepID=A0ABT8X4H6_9FLAO|nr:malectin domain-containing carbohydrate-binding protein [Flavivirga amylovorans]MDO5988878.1 malectin domain-containing carbohydrate-binding protein [Flavivirga amylovorans]